jgi:hypothetical protein
MESDCRVLMESGWRMEGFDGEWMEGAGGSGWRVEGFDGEWMEVGELNPGNEWKSVGINECE